MDTGPSRLLPAIREYETEMLDYGFAAVRLSLRNARQAASGSRFSRAIVKAGLRVVNAVHPIKRRVARTMGPVTGCG